MWVLILVTPTTYIMHGCVLTGVVSYMFLWCVLRRIKFLATERVSKLLVGVAKFILGC